MKFDCIDYLKNSLFTFLISSGLSVTSFRHFLKVTRSLNIGEKVLKKSHKSHRMYWNCMNPDQILLRYVSQEQTDKPLCCDWQRSCVGSSNPVDSLKFEVEERLECAASKKVKYTHRSDTILALPIAMDAATNKGGFYQGRTLCFTKVGPYVLPRSDPMFYHGRTLCFTTVGPYVLPRSDPMFYQGRALCFTTAGPYVSPRSDPMFYHGRTLCFTKVGPYVLPRSGPMFYQGRTLCFTTVGPYVLPWSDPMFYQGRTLCFTMVGPYVLPWSDPMFYQGRTLYFTTVGPYVLPRSDPMFYQDWTLCLMSQTSIYHTNSTQAG